MCATELTGVIDSALSCEPLIVGAVGASATAHRPVILEVNYGPDASSILHFHPTFYDEVFAVLFTDNVGATRGGDHG